MAFPTTKEEIIRQAAELIGQANINQSVGNASPLALTMGNAYDRIVRELLESYKWQFATATVQLNRLEQTSNIARWQYVYAMPASYLRIDALIPNSDYDIQENHLYSNSTELSMEYRFMVDASKFSASFVSFLVYQLAYEVSTTPAANISEAKIAKLQKDAQLKFANALVNSSQTVPNRKLRDGSLITAGYY